jgi:hypothetical protein
MKKVTLISLFLLSMAGSAVAQGKDNQRAQEHVRQEEQYRKSMVMREYDSAVLMLEEGRYQQADEKFRFVLNNVKSVPSDLAFYFGKNSFYLNKFKQSIDWLNKYIALKGTNGQYYNEAVEWKRKSEQAYLGEKKVESEKAKEVLSKDYDIDCGPSGKITCPVCKGDHVIIRKGPFGNQYQTCGYCDNHGLLTCDEYNKLLRGELKPKN